MFHSHNSPDHGQKNEEPEARKADSDRGTKIFGTWCNFHLAISISRILTNNGGKKKLVP